jgi:hypothetical protein
MTLLDHAGAAGTRVTIVSGDVHVGARGRIVSRRPEHRVAAEPEAVVHQLTSSAIVFPPPDAVALVGMRAVSKEDPAPLPSVSHVETEVVPVAPDYYLVGENNWLSIEPDSPWGVPDQRLWARWIIEADEVDPPLVIHRRGP